VDSASVGQAAVLGPKRSGLLIDVIRTVYDRLGFNVVDDNVFFQLVLARLVEPTSKRDSIRVLNEIGANPPHYNTLLNSVARAHDRKYRDRIAEKCYAYAESTGGVTLCLYDVTTLYFEAEKEDDLRKVGYSKERRVDPQIVVGLLVDRTGFPLEIGCYEGNKAETHTIIPIVKQFQDRHGIADMVIAADAGMLSSKNLRDLDDAGLRFIVGSRQTRAPGDLATYFHWEGTATDDGRVVDTITPRGTKGLDPDRVKTRAEPVWSAESHPDAWRAVWQFRRKRAVRDRQTLNLQRNKAIAIIEGDKPVKKTRFVRIKDAKKSFDEASYDRAMSLAGWKGYLTNLPASLMTAGEVIGNYHELWHVEQSFRMSKTDLRARPIFHHTRDAIEAHLTIVFTALAVERYLYAATGWSKKRIITTLKPIVETSVTIAGHTIAAADPITEAAAYIRDAVTPPG
jgi:transposase